MPNGDFTNPRYFQENAFLTNRELLEKYGYVPAISSEDYDTEHEYLAARAEVQRLRGEDYDESD